MDIITMIDEVETDLRMRSVEVSTAIDRFRYIKKELQRLPLDAAVLDTIKAKALTIVDLCAQHRNGSTANVQQNRPHRRAVQKILKAWYLEHLQHPYPNEADKQRLASLTGLTIKQISMWFTNARRRSGTNGDRFMREGVSASLVSLLPY